MEVRPMKRGGRTFYGCSNFRDEAKKCDYKLWQKPIKEPCPTCGAAFLVRGGTKVKPMAVCVTEGCKFKTPIAEPAERLDGSDESASLEAAV
jgi:DNA topoisomerase-1